MSFSFVNRAAKSEVRKWIPGPVRRSIKRVLRRAEIIDERAAAFGLGTVYENDTFVVSYPKSGNTWVRFLIASLLHPEATITFRNIERFVPTVKSSKERIREMARPRFMKSHSPKYDHFPRFIYIYRDGRDVAVSYYHYSRQNGWFDGSFSEFIRTPWPWHGSFGSWHEHVSDAVDYAQNHPERVLLLKYEDMLESPEVQTRRIAEFCQFEVGALDIAEAVEQCSFSSLQQVEQRYGSETEGRDEVKFFRSGTSGQWKEVFEEQDMQAFLSSADATLRRMDYLSS